MMPTISSLNHSQQKSSIIYLLKREYMITHEKSKQIQRLLNTLRWEATDLYELEAVVQENFDPNYKVCGHCQAQLRHILVRLREWYMSQPIEGDVPVEQPEVQAKVEVDAVEADKVGCQKCKRKKQNKA